jgi:hypothetical protein
MKKNRTWKSLLFKISHLDLEYQERKDLLDQFKVEFDKLVCQEVGTDFYKEKYGKESSTDLVKSNDDEDQLSEESAEDISDIDDSSNEDSSNDSYDEEEDNVASAEKHEVPESINKLWKLVALKTHPDRNKNNEELTSQYILASDAYKEKSYGKLLIIALELGISIPEDNKLIPYIKDNISSLEQKINHIETLALWKWINAEEPEKSLIVKFTSEIVKNRNLNSNI